eukprot:NODE_18_length_3678_cov_20.506200_g14_i0.p1 GENE.NODE_18_length_3678_cov_20.506200_g14_i0~~NODE_18_length_3678_cov_20.506200_g14_i0.p1  ORF type:complete len:1199 (+),score=399.21 NODE_18_length_3678_cov_20.506200_g14_i0:136-3597(+)
MHHLLERPVGNPDSRLKFAPDKWQKDLLDIVDKRESAVICAPTSSGKTFISFYCMYQGLKTNDKVVVYVAPSLALVNQVRADVLRWFPQKEYKSGEMFVDGKFSRNPMTMIGQLSHHPLSIARKTMKSATNCQILITDPLAFETMLMSPLYVDWAKRIRYVIFDEVHCIDEDNNGAVWERLLLLTRCPFLALSATIGNPEQFSSWMSRARTMLAKREKLDVERGWVKDTERSSETQQVHLIIHDQRYSDLEKFSYVPRGPAEKAAKPSMSLKPKGLKDRPKGASLVPIHPVTQLTTQRLQIGWPEDLSMTPKEAILLYDAMVQEVGSAHEAAAAVMKELDPEIWFTSGEHKTVNISQREARFWEGKIRDELCRWSSDTKLEPVAAKVIAQLYSPVEKAQKEFEKKVADFKADPSSPTAATTAAATPDATATPMKDTEDYVLQNFPELLVTLAAEDRLPCLVFTQDEYMSEKLAECAKKTIEQWEEQETRTPEYQRMLREMRSDRAAHNARIAVQLKTASLLSKKDENAADLGEEDMEDEMEEEPEILPDFTFVTAAQDGAGLGPGEYEKHLAQLRKQQGRAVKSYFQLWARGVGLHNSKAPFRVRLVTEILFRALHLKVVISNKTLALGIHMPCRTVVFAGDSPLLTPLQFRQMSGRAGRRGFDMIGNVVFLGVPESKISKLLVASLPSLRGHPTVTPTVSLRLLLLYNAAANLPVGATRGYREAAAAYNGNVLLSYPLLDLGDRAFRTSSLYKQPSMTGTAEDDIYAWRKLIGKYLFCHHTNWLQGEGYVDEHGRGDVPDTGFCGMAARLLKDRDPAQFVFISLLRDGVLHDLSALNSSDRFEVFRVLRRMLAAICRIFAVRCRHKSSLRDYTVCLGASKKVNLAIPRVSDAFDQSIEAHVNRVISMCSDLARSIAKEIDDAPRDTPDARGVRVPGDVFPRFELPLSSSVNFADLESKYAAPPNGSLVDILSTSTLPCNIRSPFVALSGKGDKFDSAEELVHGTRPGVFFDHDNIPLPAYIDNKLDIFADGYGIDFFSRPDPQSTCTAHAIDMSQLYQRLHELLEVMQIVHTSFTGTTPAYAMSWRMKDASDPVTWCLFELQKEFNQRMAVIDSRIKKELDKLKRKRALTLTAKKPKRPALVKRAPMAPRRF